MAAATRQDDQGNVIQVGEEGAEGEEREYQDAKGQGAGDDRGWGAPILMTLETHPIEEHMDAIPLIPCHPTLWIS